MSKIKIKQIEGGAVDQTTQQSVAGEKTFTDKTIFQNASGQHVVILGGFIYWVTDTNNLDELGNIRQGIISGRLTTQTFKGGSWS